MNDDTIKCLGPVLGRPSLINPIVCGWGPSLYATQADARDAVRKQPTRGSVALVPVMGPLAQRAVKLWSYTLWDGYDNVASNFAAAAADTKSNAIALLIDSPGGTVAGLEEAVTRMQASKGRAGKRVVAYVDEFCASAAYWIASSVADEIVVPKAGMIGSVGVIAMWADMSGMLSEAGIKVHVHRNPDGKAPAHPFGPNAEIADERMKAEVEAIADRFVTAVARARGKRKADVRGWNASMYEGAEAVRLGVADRVGSLEDALTSATSSTSSPAKASEVVARPRTPIAEDGLTDVERRICIARRIEPVDFLKRKAEQEAARRVELSEREIHECRTIARLSGDPPDAVINNWRNIKARKAVKDEAKKDELTEWEQAKCEEIARNTGTSVEQTIETWKRARAKRSERSKAREGARA